MRICIYEDGKTSDLEPLTLTRTAAELLCGLDSLAEKQGRHFGAETVGYLCRPLLADVLRERFPDAPVNDPIWLRTAPTVLVNARWLPPTPTPTGLRLAPATRRLFASGPSAGTCGGEVAFAVLDCRRLQAISPETIDDTIADLRQTLPARDAGGKLIRRAWDLIEENSSQIECDFAQACPPGERGLHPNGMAVIGPTDRLYVHPSACIDPMVAADTTKGPVWVGPDVVVSAFSRLEGPCMIGAGTQVFGAKIRAGTTLGPQCRIGGEVECSIVQGYTNKYHEGFLGHSFIGEWVNLAAGTITGDLRFDYQPIIAKWKGQKISTGRMKLGSVVGDHARTGLGVLLDCGTTVGAFASLLPSGRFAPREVASFTRCSPDGITLMSDVDAVLKGSAVAMQRRGKELTPALDKLYRRIGEPASIRPISLVPEAPLRISA